MKKGEEQAFEELYDRYSKKMLVFFIQRLHHDHAKAQDFLQNLFLKIIEKVDSFDESKKFTIWMYTIASNLCKNEYRKLVVRGKKIHNSEQEVLNRPSSDRSFEKNHDLNFFTQCLNKELHAMDEKYSTTFDLRHRQYLSIQEISKIMACPEGTVKSRLFFTTKRLSEKLRMFNSQNLR